MAKWKMGHNRTMQYYNQSAGYKQLKIRLIKITNLNFGDINFHAPIIETNS